MRCGCLIWGKTVVLPRLLDDVDFNDVRIDALVRITQEVVV